MRVEVRLYSTLRRYLPGVKLGEAHGVSLPAGATIADLLRALGVPEGEARLAFVDGQSVGLDHPLSEGDQVGLFPPVAGG